MFTLLYFTDVAEKCYPQKKEQDLGLLQIVETWEGLS
jgi:hypothetical protein